MLSVPPGPVARPGVASGSRRGLRVVSTVSAAADRGENRLVAPPPLPAAELSALSSSIDTVAARIGEVAAERRRAVDRGRDAQDSTTLELDAIEAALRAANRRLSRLLRQR